MELANESQTALELILSVVLPALAALLSIAVLALAGAGAWASIQEMARRVRPLVDAPDDLIIITLDGLGEWVLHRQLDAALIAKLMTATCDAISATTPPPEPTPAPEPAPGDVTGFTVSNITTEPEPPCEPAA